MKWNLFDDRYGRYSNVVVEDRLQEHADKIASETELGHVRIDGDTIVTDSNGNIKINDTISGLVLSNIIFNIGTTVSIGRVNESFFPSTINAKLKQVNVTILNPSSTDLVFNIQKTNDFITYENVFTTPMTIPANSHVSEFIINGDFSISNGDCLFLNVVSTDNSAKNMVVNLTIEKQ